MGLTLHRNLIWGSVSGSQGGGLGALGALLQGHKHWRRGKRQVTEEAGLVMLQASFSPRSLGLLRASLGRRPMLMGQETPVWPQALNKLSVRLVLISVSSPPPPPSSHSDAISLSFVQWQVSAKSSGCAHPAVPPSAPHYPHDLYQ